MSVVVDLLRPVVVLGLWTTFMFLWMLGTRLPAMTKARVDAQAAQDTSRLRDLLPAEVQRVANNYNHLFEAPTLFYAMTLTIAVLGHADEIHVACAWVYTVARIVHSVVQATVDIVMVRFSIFVVSWFALGTMVVREAFAVF